MRRFAFCALAALLAGCGGRAVKPERSPAKKPSGVKIVAEERFLLGRGVTVDALHDFNDFVLRSAQAAAEEMGPDTALKAGFNYRVEPVGAIEPSSEIKISCVMKAEAAKKGEQTCEQFFELIGSKYTMK